MLDSRKPLDGVFSDGQVAEVGDHEDPFHTANSFNFIMMQVQNLQLFEGVHAGLGGDLCDVVVREVKLDDVDATVYKFKFITDDVVAGQDQDLELLRGDYLLVEKNVMLSLGFFLLDV